MGGGGDLRGCVGRTSIKLLCRRHSNNPYRLLGALPLAPLTLNALLYTHT